MIGGGEHRRHRYTHEGVSMKDVRGAAAKAIIPSIPHVMLFTGLKISSFFQKFSGRYLFIIHKTSFVAERTCGGRRRGDIFLDSKVLRAIFWNMTKLVL